MTALPATPQPVSEAEYLEFERNSDTKHEYINGQIYAMVGASLRHNRITINVQSSIHAQLRKRPCDVFPSDMRLKIIATAQYTYPDVSGLCGDPDLTDDHLDTYTNPLFIVEVLSPSTERYDRGPKFDAYKTIPSLQDYVLIAQHHPLVEHFRRDGENWIHASAATLDTSVYLPSIDCTLALSDIYEKVTFEQ